MGADLRGRTVLVSGATSTSGAVATRELIAAGASVVAVGRSAHKLEVLADFGARAERADLAAAEEVRRLVDRLQTDGVSVDGVLHLVGGWRGGGGLAGQSEADYRFLETSFTALRHVSRAFDASLRASNGARLAIVSSTAVDRPLAGGANYAAVKAASEAWTRAVAQGFEKAARDRGAPLEAAACIFRVTELTGLERRLAHAYIDLWSADAAAVNGSIVDLREAADSDENE